MSLLETRSVGVALGDVQVLWNASIAVESGEIVCLLGPNGSGKSTLMNSISRLNKIVSGEVWFDGHALHRLPPHKISPLGISHVLERHRLFPYMTVLENLLLGAGPHPDPALLKNSFARVYELFPRLKERERQLANSMSGGEQQMCAIGRALMAKPSMILLDEPSMGLAPQLTEEIFEIVSRLNREAGVTLLLAEQNAGIALRHASYGYILENGRVVLDGEASTLRDNEDVKEFYLGLSATGRRSFRDIKSYKRRKRWL
jgi:branched-chain amino acid transport system ATP-binding protein